MVVIKDEIVKVRAAAKFRREVFAALLNLLLFGFVYLLLFSASIGLIVLAIIGSVYLVGLHFSWLTMMLSIGLILMSTSVLVYLLKFIFYREIHDKPEWLEITERDEPKLFSFINEVAVRTGSEMPGHVYLSRDVNAAMLRDKHGFFSVFRRKRNLVIGLGLMEGLNESEFQAVLAHEFGHFSQKSTRLGFRVANINRSLYDMIGSDLSFETMAGNQGVLPAFYILFGGIALLMLKGSRAILKKLFYVLSMSYSRMSCQLEYNADEVSARVAGSSSAMSSLLKAEFLSNAFDQTLSYYQNGIDRLIYAKNIYVLYQYMIPALAKLNDVPMKGSLPCIDYELWKQRFFQGLVIRNPWSDHPDTDQRISFLNSLQLRSEAGGKEVATHLLADAATSEIALTNLFYARITFPGNATEESPDIAIAAFAERFQNLQYDPAFNKYYYYKYPYHFDLRAAADSCEEIMDPGSLFSDEMSRCCFEERCLSGDLLTLQEISKGNLRVRNFVYKGVEYRLSDVRSLLHNLESRRNDLQKRILQNDIRIYRYFRSLAGVQAKAEVLDEIYQFWFDVDQQYPDFDLKFQEIARSSAFMMNVCSEREKQKGLERLESVEGSFKETVMAMLKNPYYNQFVTQEEANRLQKYAASEYVYYIEPRYYIEETTHLIDSISIFKSKIDEAYTIAINTLLDAQSALLAEAK